MVILRARMVSIAALALAGAWLACLAPAARAQTAPAPQSADEKAIAEFNKRYLKAINDGDIEALASLTDDGHMMISSGGAPTVGKQALVDAMARAFKTTRFNESWAPQETVVSGDLAYQRGTFVVEATPKAGGETTRTTGNFLRIYRKQADGRWLMTHDMWNGQRPRDAQ
jgi:uncharacterized protein (TIGR02246 family)